MNKTLFAFLCSFCLIITAHAQPVLNSSDLSGAPGTSITFSSMTDPGTVDVGPAGANQTWNFTGMTTVFTQTHEYHDPATTAWGASFPNANRCFKIADITPEMFHYFELTTTDYWTLGFGSDMMTINYNNTQSL
ncbi:hypothetical protein KJ564_05260, partial [bacterium]|nr:hypothetical protein [bacterium]